MNIGWAVKHIKRDRKVRRKDWVTGRYATEDYIYYDGVDIRIYCAYNEESCIWEPQSCDLFGLDWEFAERYRKKGKKVSEFEKCFG